MHNLELIFIPRELVKIAPHKNIALCLIRIDDPDLRLVAFVLQNPCDDLVTWGDTRSSQNERNIFESMLLTVDGETLVAAVSDFPRRTLDFDLLTLQETLEDVTHCTARLGSVWIVCLNDKIEYAIVFVSKDGSDGDVRGVRLTGHQNGSQLGYAGQFRGQASLLVVGA